MPIITIDGGGLSANKKAFEIYLLKYSHHHLSVTERYI